jgi:hypothetical protein
MCRSTFWERRNTQENETLSPLVSKKTAALSIGEFCEDQRVSENEVATDFTAQSQNITPGAITAMAAVINAMAAPLERRGTAF